MTHNLVVANDTNDEYVKFDVLVPDGYNSLSLNSINGSIINQNYLKVGDKLRFEFTNNEIIYDKNISFNPDLVYYNNNIGRKKASNRTFKEIKLNLFDFYHVVYLPIYYFVYGNNLYYIYNPCDEDYQKSEPVLYLNDVQISNWNLPESSQLYASFTGQYVLALKKTDKIEPIDVVIGESIGNSKTRPQDLGAYSLQAEIVNDVKTQYINSTAYNYGSAWTYPINNLIMKHKESIIIETHQPQTITLLAAEKNDADEYVAINHSLSSLIIINSQSDNYVFKQQAPTPTDLTHDIYLNEPINIIKYVIITKDNNDEYINLYSTHIEVLPLAKIQGVDLVNPTNKYYYYDNSIQQFLNKSDVIVDDWYYTTNIYYILIEINTGTHDNPHWVDEGFDFHTDGFYINDYYQTGRFVEFNRTIYVIMNESDSILYEARFKIYNDEKDSYDFDGDLSVFIIGTVKSVVGQNLCIAASINSGEFPEYTYNMVNTELYQKPIQFFDTQTFNPEDLKLKAKNDTIELSMGSLRNVNHIIKYESVNNNIETTIQNVDVVYDASTSIPLNVFVPQRTTFKMKQFPDFKPNQFVHGWFIINDIKGENAQDLDESNISVFLATGHNSLNIDPIKKDDAKFKTFNGSLLFDRSDSRITRLFSNDITNSCLGYINDILSAKLARYYFVCNYNIFNTFLSTKSKLSITNNNKTLKFVYDKYQNDLYVGAHEIVLASCFDIIKLIGSENLVNNCMPSLQTEEQAVNINNERWTYSKLMDSNNKELLNNPKTLFYYKFFHYYNSGLNEEPHNGFGAVDDINGTVGGLNVELVDKKLLTLNISGNQPKVDLNPLITYKPFFVMNNKHVYDNYSDIESKISNIGYNTNQTVDYGIIQTLPSYRIYKNANFEQTDLTITTGGIKTLHPIYLQSTPKILINNMLYMFDVIINHIIKSYGELNKSNFGFVDLFVNNQFDEIVDDVYYNVIRFGKKRVFISNNRYAMIAHSLDSLMIMNYITPESINGYDNIDDLIDSIPGGENNEEIINDFITDNPLTNIQLFSHRDFNFLNIVSQYNQVILKTNYIEQIIYNDTIAAIYYNFTDNNDEVVNANVINGYINNINSYNNIKNIKILIIKLGEFLQFPKILYGISNCFNNTLNVSIDNLNMSKYKEVSEENQRINVYLYGVMFKYHQLSLGYQNLYNELSEEYKISRALGNRHFQLYLIDEFGRYIPNQDTSQGFKNNLYLEITLNSADSKPQA